MNSLRSRTTDTTMQIMQRTFCTRTTHRSGMLLNADELVSLAHLPSASVRIPQLKREDARTKAAPQIVQGHAFVLGENSHAGKATPVTLQRRTTVAALLRDRRIRHRQVDPAPQPDHAGHRKRRRDRGPRSSRGSDRRDSGPHPEAAARRCGAPRSIGRSLSGGIQRPLRRNSEVEKNLLGVRSCRRLPQAFDQLG